MEIDFDGDFEAHRMSIFHGRLEAPGLDSSNRLLIQTHAQAAQNADIGRMALSVNNHTQRANTLILGLARFL